MALIKREILTGGGVGAGAGEGENAKNRVK